MRTCRFCAEEIQDAAIVCKHCHRDLTPPKAKSWGWGQAVLLLVLVTLAAAWLVGGSPTVGPKYAAFEARRAAWHWECDEFVGKTPNEINAIYMPGFADERGRTCKQELDAMTAYGKEQGWN